MFRLALTLFGADALIRRWKIFLAAGVLVLLVGLMVLVDLVDGVADLAHWIFGLIMLFQGLAEMLVGATHTAARRRFQLFRGAGLVVFACLVLDFPWDNSIATAVLFAAAFLTNGLLRIASSLLIRYPGWRMSNLTGWAYLLMALLMITEWPLPSSMNVSFCTGIALVFSGFVLMRGAWRLRRLPRGSRLAAIALYKRRRDEDSATPVPAAAGAPAAGHDQMVVHVWVASDTIKEERINLPLIDRYFVSMSRRGLVSTGHVALACGDDLYISHHPEVRLAINQQNIVGHMRATSHNDHPGVWLPSYDGEAEATRPSTVRVRFRRYNRAYLQAFWERYRQDTTYNLTHRNCSVVVTEAIDSAVEGVFADRPFWPTFVRLWLNPDMWMAGGTRVRAESIAWTPGLALDYAVAMRRLTDPRQDLRLHLSRWWRTRRKPRGG